MTVAELATTITRPHETNIVTLDIERIPGTFRVNPWRGTLTVEGEFWDLSGHRHAIGRRIRPDEVVTWPRTICVAWRRYGTKRVEFAAEWDDGGREAMLRRVWDVYDNANVIVGHNLASFDTKHLKAEWAQLGLKPPRPWKTIDTLTVARREFAFESNQLGSLCERMGVPGKVDKYDVQTAKDALAGVVAAQKRLRRYNVGDIEASEALFLSMVGWMPNMPHVARPLGDEKVCNQCGSDDLKLRDTKYRAVVLDYALYTCGNCGGHSRGGWVARVASTRGAR